MQNIGGVFVVLLCGLALAIMVAILEFCWNSRKNAMNDRSGGCWSLVTKCYCVHCFRQSLCSEMAEELRFAMRCHGSRQKPALRRSCSRCSPGKYFRKCTNIFVIVHFVNISTTFQRAPTCQLGTASELQLSTQLGESPQLVQQLGTSCCP